MSAFRIQKTRRRLLTTTKRVCVIWKTISDSTKLPLILRRASARLFFMQNHFSAVASPGLVVMSLYTAVSLGSRLENGIMLLPILIMPCPSLALRRNSSCGLDSPYRRSKASRLFDCRSIMTNSLLESSASAYFYNPIISWIKKGTLVE